MEDISLLCQANLLAITKHWSSVGMEDLDYIRTVRVLIECMQPFLIESDSANDTDKTLVQLKDYARSLYVEHCVKSNPRPAKRDDYEDECREIFNHLFEYDEYPDA